MNKFWISIGLLLLLGCASKSADQQVEQGLETSEASETSGVVEQALTGSDAGSGASGMTVNKASSSAATAPAGSKQREIYTATLPISSGVAGSSAVGGRATGSATTAQAAAKPSLAGSGQARPSSAANSAGSAQAQYDQALAAYNQRNFSHSQQLFQDFIRDYPQNKLMPNALYWEAETLYARGKYVDAIFLFKEVQAKYAKHPKASDALLKAAMSYKQLGDVDNANLHLQILSEDYPQSNALNRAKKLGLL